MKEPVQSIDMFPLQVSVLKGYMTYVSKERLISDIAPQKTCIITD